MAFSRVWLPLPLLADSPQGLLCGAHSSFAFSNFLQFSFKHLKCSVSRFFWSKTHHFVRLSLMTITCLRLSSFKNVLYSATSEVPVKSSAAQTSNIHYLLVKTSLLGF